MGNASKKPFFAPCGPSCSTGDSFCSRRGIPAVFCTPCIWAWMLVLALMAFGCTGSRDAAPATDLPEAPVVTAIEGAAAHWIRGSSLIWDAPASAHRFELRYSPDADITVDENGVAGGQTIALQSGAGLDFRIADQYRHIAARPVFSLDAPREVMVEALRSQLIAVAYNRAGQPVAATRVQAAGVIDQLFYFDGTLGPEYQQDTITLRVWAPTAQSLSLMLYDADKNRLRVVEPEQQQPANGVYTFRGSASEWDRLFYRFTITVYHYQADAVLTYEVTDPYSVSLSTDSQYSQFVNLFGDASLKPDGWSDLRKSLPHPADITLYEGHVRDFSAWDDSVAPEHRATYTAFTYNGRRRALSNGMRHLARLAESGMSHIHLLPINDITTVIEDRSQRINLDDPFSRVCEVLHPDVVAAHGISPDCESYQDVPVREVFTQWATDDPATERIQQLYNAVDGQPGLQAYDGFNWGYDPWHFNVPEGSYSTDPDGPRRIYELREAVMALYEIGLLVVVDVVYNHTSAYGLHEKSVLDRVVPGYYQRFDATSGAIETSTCCPNTAPEHRMMEKLMIDSILLWAEAYKIDSFRFDLMGHHSLTNMTRIQNALKTLTLDENGVDGANVYLYGEGWNFGEVANNRIFDQATQFMTAGSGIGNFNDRLRDGIRGRNFTDVGRAQGFVSGQLLFPNEADTSSEEERRSGLLYQADQIRVGLAGNLRTYIYRDRTGVIGDGGRDGIGYTLNPRENVNYIDKHDNETLFDNTQTKLPLDMSTDDRVRIHTLSNAFIHFGQGVPFYHMGTDILRSKSLDRNSYTSGDWFNRIDFTMQTHNWATGIPPRWDNERRWDEIRELFEKANVQVTPDHIRLAHELFLEQLQIRYSTPLLRLRSSADVIERVRFHNVGSQQEAGLIVMSVSDGNCAGTILDEHYDGILVVFNADLQERSFTVDLPGLEGMELHPVQASSVDPVVRTARVEGTTFTVPAHTAAVFVKPTDLPLQEFPCNGY